MRIITRRIEELIRISKKLDASFKEYKLLTKTLTAEETKFLFDYLINNNSIKELYKDYADNFPCKDVQPASIEKFLKNNWSKFLMRFVDFWKQDKTISIQLSNEDLNKEIVILL